MKKLVSFVTLLLLSVASYAHVWEIRVNQEQDGSLTWYLQSYHTVGSCGIANSGLTVNGVNYPLQSEHNGSIVGLSNTVVAVNNSLGPNRFSYAIVRTPYLGTSISVQPYSTNACWAFSVGGVGNFTPPPPPVCTSCPITGWSNTNGTPSNNGTFCDRTDDYLPTTITVNHLTCASITGNGQFNVVFNNVTYGPYNFTASSNATTLNLNLPYGTTNSTQLSVVSGFPCTVTHGLTVPNGAFNGVGETIAPSITCPSAVAVSADNGSCAATNVSLGTPATSDNCGVASVTNNAPSSFPVGNTTVTWTVTDINGNTNSCTQTVTVTDDQAPSITCPAPVSVNADNGACAATNVNLGTPTTDDNCGVQGVTNDAPSSYAVGNTTVTWTVTDVHGNSSTCTQTVTVTDNQAPSISCPAAVSVNADNGSCAATNVVLGTPSTDDNCGVQGVTNDAPSSYAVGNTTVTWTVTDIHGNTNTCTQTVTVTDNEAPQVACKNYAVTLYNGVGTITAADIDNGSTDNCGIASMNVSPSSFTCANAGANTVTLTVTDIHGNSSTCTATVTVYQPTCTIAVTPSNNTYTDGVPTHIFLGYGPQSATATCNATGGTGFTYSWSPSSRLSCANCQSPIFTPTAAGNYTYTVTATNSGGCSTICTVTFCVLDIRVPGQNNKVYICHVPPGNNQNPQTLSISANAVPSHIGLHSGDRLGSCNQSCGNAKGEEQGMGIVASDEFKLYPNPTTGIFKLEVPYTVTIDKVTVMDMTGKVIEVKTNVVGNTTFDLSHVAKGVYYIQANYGNEAFRSKVVVQ